MKKVSIIFLFILLCEICYCRNQRYSIEAEMKDFFVETLRNNYGEKPEDKLLIDFFTRFQNNKGEINLIIDKPRLNEINNKLSEDSVYRRYYPRLSFAETEEEHINAISDSSADIFFGPRKKNRTLTKFGVYINFNYLSQVEKELNNEAIDSIVNYYQYTGLISYFIVADSYLKCEKCISELGTKEFLAILFWRYFCDLADYEFYKIN